VGVGHGCLKFLNGTLVWIQEDHVVMVCLTLLPAKEMIKIRRNTEFLELELDSNSIYKYRGKKLCLGVEF